MKNYEKNKIRDYIKNIQRELNKSNPVSDYIHTQLNLIKEILG